MEKVSDINRILARIDWEDVDIEDQIHATHWSECTTQDQKERETLIKRRDARQVNTGIAGTTLFNGFNDRLSNARNNPFRLNYEGIGLLDRTPADGFRSIIKIPVWTAVGEVVYTGVIYDDQSKVIGISVETPVETN